MQDVGNGGGCASVGAGGGYMGNLYFLNIFANVL